MSKRDGQLKFYCTIERSKVYQVLLVCYMKDFNVERLAVRTSIV